MKLSYYVAVEKELELYKLLILTDDLVYGKVSLKYHYDRQLNASDSEA